MYVRSLSIQNLRSFASVEIPLCHPGSDTPPARDEVPHLDNVTLLLGSNGAGKTSVLRAIALSTLAPALAMGSGYVPYALVRRVKGRIAEKASVKAQVILHEQDGLKEGDEEDMEAILVAPTRGYTDRFLIETRAPRWHVRLYDEESSAFLVLGYGATRRVETGPGSVESRAKERILRYRRVAGLFEEHVTLMPLAAWMPQVFRKDKKRHREVVDLMNQLLPDAEMLGRWEGTEAPEALFSRGGSVLPYPALSDGYRAFICWVGDLLYHLNMNCPREQRLVDLRGVVLVDEVDLHLHPEWQRQLVPSLSRAFPRLQFILTSHSPLVVGTLSSRNVLLLEEQEQSKGVRATEVRRLGEELYGLSADQILTSESFQLESTRDERFFERLKDAAEGAREGGADEALRFMRMVAGGAGAETAPIPATRENAPTILQGHRGIVYAVAWDPSRYRLASAAGDKTVRIWDVENQKALRTLEGHEDKVLALAWDPSGRLLASASADTTIRLWDVATGKEVAVLRGHEGWVDSVAWNPAGSQLASSSLDKTVRVWDVAKGEAQSVLRGHEDSLFAVAWDPDGRLLASASGDKTVWVWNAVTGNKLSALQEHTDKVLSVAWSPSGRQLASASSDKTVRVWDAVTNEELLVLRGHRDKVRHVAWDVSGQRLASASLDGTVRVWDAVTGKELADLQGHKDGVFSVDWGAGDWLASAAADKSVRVWKVASQPETSGAEALTPSSAASLSDKKRSRAAPASKLARKRAASRKKAPRRRSGK